MCNTAYVPGEPPCDEDHGEPISSRDEPADQLLSPSSEAGSPIPNVNVAPWLKTYEGRNATRWALRMWIKGGSDVCQRIIEICESDGYMLTVERCLSLTNVADVLAQMLTIEGRRLGLDMDCEPRENGVTICLRDGLPLPTYCFRTTQSAQRLLAVWLSLPSSAAEAAEIALRTEQPQENG